MYSYIANVSAHQNTCADSAAGKKPRQTAERREANKRSQEALEAKEKQHREKVAAIEKQNETQLEDKKEFEMPMESAGTNVILAIWCDGSR